MCRSPVRSDVPARTRDDRDVSPPPRQNSKDYANGSRYDDDEATRVDRAASLSPKAEDAPSARRAASPDDEY